MIDQLTLPCMHLVMKRSMTAQQLLPLSCHSLTLHILALQLNFIHSLLTFQSVDVVTLWHLIEPYTLLSFLGCISCSAPA